MKISSIFTKVNSSHWYISSSISISAHNIGKMGSIRIFTFEQWSNTKHGDSYSSPESSIWLMKSVVGDKPKIRFMLDRWCSAVHICRRLHTTLTTDDVCNEGEKPGELYSVYSHHTRCPREYRRVLNTGTSQKQNDTSHWSSSRCDSIYARQRSYRSNSHMCRSPSAPISYNNWFVRTNLRTLNV